MGSGDRVVKKLYMRQHSNLFRRWTAKSQKDQTHAIGEVVEDDVLELHGKPKVMFRILCRNKQRMLQKAWNSWTANADVKHDYSYDLRTILLRPLQDDCTRSELEIEVMFKWVTQYANSDPTGIAIILYNCKSKKLVVSALQQLRLECYHPRDGIVFQGNLPKQEDGHFTILKGECEVVQFQHNSISLLKLQELTRRKRWDEVRTLLDRAQSLAHIAAPAGFGELNTLTAVKRSATVKAGPDGCELLVVPKQNFMECHSTQRATADYKNGPLPSEAIDFLRQSGLAHKISASDLIAAAKSVIKRTLSLGEVLYCKGEVVNSMFLIVSGEFVLDISDHKASNGKYQPFMNCSGDNVHHFGPGSILGDEGILGQSGRFEATAVAVSEIAVCFEAVGFGLTFLAERLGASRYCALAYKDLPRWTPSLRFAEQANLYSHFHSLRKAVAQQRPSRGSKSKTYLEDKYISVAADFANSPMMMLHRPVMVDELLEQQRINVSNPTISMSAVTVNELSVNKDPNMRKIGLIQLRGKRDGKGPTLLGDNSRGGGHRAASPRKAVSGHNSHHSASHGNKHVARHHHQNGNSSRGSSRPTTASSVAVQICDSAVSSKILSSGLTVRILTPTALHHAIELNKGAKKRFHDYFKVSAQENILEHGLHDHIIESHEEIANGVAEIDKINAVLLRTTENKLRSSMHAYRDRVTERAELLLDLTQSSENATMVQTLHNFIANTMHSLEDLDEASGTTHSESQADGDSFESLIHVIEGAGLHVHIDAEDSRKNSLGSVDPVLLRQVLAAELARPLTKMELYYMWIDRHISKAQEAAEAAVATPVGPAGLARAKSIRSISPTELDSRVSTAQDIARIERVDQPNRPASKPDASSGLVQAINRPNSPPQTASSISPSLVQSFALPTEPGYIPRGPRAKVPLSTAIPWHPMSPSSKRLDPICIPLQLPNISNGRSSSLSPPKLHTTRTDQSDDDIAELEMSPVSNKKPDGELTSPINKAFGLHAHRKMTAAAIFDKTRLGNRMTESEEKAVILLDKFSRCPVPNTRRLIQSSVINISIEQRVEDQLEIVLKRLEHERHDDTNEIATFLSDVHALDFPVLKKHKPGEGWNTRYPSLKGSTDNFNEVATSLRLTKLLAKDGLVCEVEDEILPKKIIKPKRKGGGNLAGGKQLGDDDDDQDPAMFGMYTGRPSDGLATARSSPNSFPSSGGPVSGLPHSEKMPPIVAALELSRLNVTSVPTEDIDDGAATDSVMDSCSMESDGGRDSPSVALGDGFGTNRSAGSNLSRREITQHKRMQKISGKLDRTFSMIAPELDGIKLSARLVSARDKTLGTLKSVYEGPQGASRISLSSGGDDGSNTIDESPLGTVRSRLSNSPTIPTPRADPNLASLQTLEATTEPTALPSSPDRISSSIAIASIVPTRSVTASPDINATHVSPVRTRHVAAMKEEPIERGQLAVVNPRSTAMDKYYDCICNEKSSRSFLDGKRSALKYSKFKLTRPLELQQPEKINLSFLNTLEYCMEKNLEKQRGGNVTEKKPWRHPDFSQSTESKLQRRNEEIQGRLNDILMQSHIAVTSAEAAARQVKDTEIDAWTDSTIKISGAYKSGPSMSFPVLVAKLGTNVVHSRTKRWGTGQMADIGAACDDEPIKGPPTYLEVFKRASHHKKRLSLAEQIKSSNFGNST